MKTQLHIVWFNKSKRYGEAVVWSGKYMDSTVLITEDACIDGAPNKGDGMLALLRRDADGILQVVKAENNTSHYPN